MKKDIFEFNHIDNLLSENEIKTIKEFYEHYHKKFWCFKKTFKKNILKFLMKVLNKYLWNFINDNRNNLWRFNNESNHSWCY